ncbi:hypothetical protein L2E82_39490 [Cichorium intybus]|uniref:Uncharacterized protein n=1 Tax=Cichorium intybus TaxID=13427 RepID=A0ACB9AHN6_CICIN|nr:hypothetical protein L2E82_39490 [Cichorium intybus]
MERRYSTTGIDYAVANNEVPGRAPELANLIKQRIWHLGVVIRSMVHLRDIVASRLEYATRGPFELTETLNRLTVTTLAIIIKTRGIADVDLLLYLPTMLEQILTNSQHTWSDKTLCYFVAVIRDALVGRVNKRGIAIQAWQQAVTAV